MAILPDGNIAAERTNDKRAGAISRLRYTVTEISTVRCGFLNEKALHGDRDMVDIHTIPNCPQKSISL